MTDTEQVVLLLIVLAALMAAFYIFVRLLIRRKIGHRVAELEVHENSEWTLALMAEPDRKYNLCFEFKIRHSGGEDHFGLLVDYVCSTGDEDSVAEKAGIGNLITSDAVRKIVTAYNVSLTSIGGRSKYRAKVIICSVGPFSNRREIAARGSVSGSSETELDTGKIFFSRQG